MTSIALFRPSSYGFLAPEREWRMVRPPRFGAVVLYGPALAQMFALAATGARPEADQPDLASDDFEIYYISNPPQPLLSYDIAPAKPDGATTQ